jgi:hypothetical protein
MIAEMPTFVFGHQNWASDRVRTHPTVARSSARHAEGQDRSG